MTRHWWDKIMNSRLFAPVIAGLAAALTGAGAARGAGRTDQHL